MRVLVTGATTPLGIALVKALLADHDVERVIAVGREPIAIADERVHAHAIDLTRPRVLHDFIVGTGKRERVDTVIHNMHHRAAGDEGPRIRAQNVDVTRELVTACVAHPTIRRFVYRSFADVYAYRHATTTLIDEDAPLDFDPRLPQWLTDRVVADLTVCAHAAPTLEVAVLRCAEILAPSIGSQLWDYLQSRVCLRPLGFDPMINVLSSDDAVRALVMAAKSRASGVFNIRGATTLPLSEAIQLAGRADLPVPGTMMGPLYSLRRRVTGSEFRYDLNLQRFHVGGILDGTRARDELGYVPEAPVHWPQPWWRELLARLGAQDARCS